jgi:hypothetical protein
MPRIDHATKPFPALAGRIFDDWQALESALASMPAQTVRSNAVLHGRRDIAASAIGSRLLTEVIELDFAASGQRIWCTRGDVAEELAGRLAKGARSLADALGSALGSDQAWQLQTHIDRGRLVLWLQLAASDDFGALCGRLVRESPHIVELCNIGPETRGRTGGS